MFEVDTNTGRITINGQFTGLHVTQARNGTIVYTPEGAPGGYKKHAMPHARYSLAHDAPRPLHATPELAEQYKSAGRAQFKTDLLALLMSLKLAELRQAEKRERDARAAYAAAEEVGGGPAYAAATTALEDACAYLQAAEEAFDAAQGAQEQDV